MSSSPSLQYHLVYFILAASLSSSLVVQPSVKLDVDMKFPEINPIPGRWSSVCDIRNAKRIYKRSRVLFLPVNGNFMSGVSKQHNKVPNGFKSIKKYFRDIVNTDSNSRWRYSYSDSGGILVKCSKFWKLIIFSFDHIIVISHLYFYTNISMK